MRNKQNGICLEKINLWVVPEICFYLVRKVSEIHKFRCSITRFWFCSTFMELLFLFRMFSLPHIFCLFLNLTLHRPYTTFNFGTWKKILEDVISRRYLDWKIKGTVIKLVDRFLFKKKRQWKEEEDRFPITAYFFFYNKYKRFTMSEPLKMFFLKLQPFLKITICVGGSGWMLQNISFVNFFKLE